MRDLNFATYGMVPTRNGGVFYTVPYPSRIGYAVPVSNPNNIVIFSISPDNGLGFAAQPGVVIMGQGFQQGLTIQYTGLSDSQPGIVTQVGDTQIVNTAPSLNYGVYDVIVTNPDGTTFTLPAAYTVS